jgi:hypothetical protein
MRSKKIKFSNNRVRFMLAGNHQTHQQTHLKKKNIADPEISIAKKYRMLNDYVVVTDGQIIT